MSKKRVPYTRAKIVADELVALLSPYCKQIEIAGSIRRKKETVGDIEIVCVPKIVVELDLFGTHQGAIRRPIDSFLEQLETTFTKNGELAKQFTYQDMQVDLFLTTFDKWGVIFTIRTGSGEFSRKLVTSRRHGGYLPSFLKIKDGRVMRGSVKLDTSTEELFFKAIELEYIHPSLR